MMVIQTVYKCEQQEYELASNRAMRQCHYIGSYCKSKVLGACMEKRFSYCCFKSPLGRVLQEQFRSQSGLDFGSAKNPSCDGISIEDFAKVDWEKIDLSEWVAMAQEAGMLGADMEKLTMDALTGTGGPFDYKGERLNAAERAQKRLEDTPIDDVRKGLQEEYVFPGDEFYAPAQ